MEVKDEDGLTLLHWAADRGFPVIAQQILRLAPGLINVQVIYCVFERYRAKIREWRGRKSANIRGGNSPAGVVIEEIKRPD